MLFHFPASGVRFWLRKLTKLRKKWKCHCHLFDLHFLGENWDINVVGAPKMGRWHAKKQQKTNWKHWNKWNTSFFDSVNFPIKKFDINILYIYIYIYIYYSNECIKKFLCKKSHKHPSSWNNKFIIHTYMCMYTKNEWKFLFAFQKA
jgi:hypothetical protein